MSDNIQSHGLTRRQFLKTTAATAALVAVGDKLFGGPVSSLVANAATAPAVTEDKWIPTVCWHCRASCNVLAHRVNGVIIRTEGNPDSPKNRGRLCAKGNAIINRVYNPYQVKTPLKRTNPVRAQKNPTTGDWEITDPGWVEISWDEALDTVAQRLKKIRADNPNKFVFMSGWNLKGNITDRFSNAFGTINRISGFGGIQCGASFHFVSNLVHRVANQWPDKDYNLLDVGADLNGVSLNKGGVEDTHTWLEARKKGGKGIVFEPRYSVSAMKADTWIPIRPGTGAGMACGLAMINIIINEMKTYDVEFMKMRSNAPYLIGPDGHYVRATDNLMEDAVYKKIKQGKPLVWDPVDKKAKTWDDKTIKDFALEGTYTVNGVQCQPAFQLLKDSVKKYTPEWSATISDVPADKLRWVAKEFVSTAQIGSTIEIEGHKFPYRPATMYRKGFITRHRHHSTMLNFCGILLNMLVGAIDVPGGMLQEGDVDMKCSPVDGVVIPAGHTAHRFKWPPDAYQQDTFFPMAYKAWQFFWLQLLDRKKYYTPYEVESLSVLGANPVTDGASPDMIMEAFTKIPFVWALAYHLDEPCEMSDIVFPEPGFTGRLFYDEDGKGIRQPLTDQPIYDQRLPEDILTELANRIGMLEDWNKQANNTLQLKGANALDTKTKYPWSEVLDRYLKQSFGKEHDLAWFKTHGFFEVERPKVENYAYYSCPEARYPLYWDYVKWRGEELKRELDKVGVQHPHPEVYDEYVALPFWVESAIEEAPPEFDLWAVNWKGNLMAMGMTADNPWLYETTKRFDPYVMNVMISTEAAKARGIKDGDLVVVESGSSGLKLEGEARVTECIHPRTVAIGGQYGRYSRHMNPFTRQGPHYNRLASLSAKYNDSLACGFEIGAKVKVQKKV